MASSQSSNWRTRPTPPSSNLSTLQYDDTPEPRASSWQQRRQHSKRSYSPNSNPPRLPQTRNRSPPPPAREATQQPETNPSNDSITQGRRIYLGNLLYQTQPAEIDDLLLTAGYQDQYESVHISIDPVTGRNPGYCFIDFGLKSSADDALQNLLGMRVRGRPVKVGPCVPKGAEVRWKSEGFKPTFQRWGDWKGGNDGGDEDVQGGDEGGGGGARLPSKDDGRLSKQGPDCALEHLDDMQGATTAPRLYVGGLDRMIDQETHEREMCQLLNGYKFVAISKRITPHAGTRTMRGNHHYCFVDFESAEDAETARLALNKRYWAGERLKVSWAKGGIMF